MFWGDLPPSKILDFQREPNMFSSSEWKRPLRQIFTWFVRFVSCLCHRRFFNHFFSFTTIFSWFYPSYTLDTSQLFIYMQSSLGAPLIFPCECFWQKVFLKVLSLQLCEMSTPPVDNRSSSLSSRESDKKTDLGRTFFQKDISLKIDIKEVPSFYEPSFGHQMKNQNVPKLSLTPRKAILSRPLPRSYLHFIAKVLTNFVRWIFNEKSYPSRCLGWQQYWICGCGGRTPLVSLYTQGKGRFSLMISLINDPTRFSFSLQKTFEESIISEENDFVTIPKWWNNFKNTFLPHNDCSTERSY